MSQPISDESYKRASLEILVEIHALLSASTIPPPGDLMPPEQRSAALATVQALKNEMPKYAAGTRARLKEKFGIDLL
jgi:hypothetical protein